MTHEGPFSHTMEDQWPELDGHCCRDAALEYRWREAVGD